MQPTALFDSGAPRLMPVVRARRLFVTERMVGAPLEKRARFLGRSIDPSIATCGGPWSVGPGPAEFHAAPASVRSASA